MVSKFSIPRRILGKTGYKISSISLGCAPIGSVYGKMELNEGLNIVREALSHGINIMDTSPFYGETRSEKNLGIILNKLKDEFPRNEYYLCTKIGRYRDDYFDFSPKKIKTSIEESLNRLQTDYIDIMHAHDVEYSENIQQIWNETLPTLEEYKAKGIIKNIGISGRPLSVLDYVMKQYGYDKIDTIITYNKYILFDTRLLNFIQRFKKYNIGIIHGGTTGLGLLTLQGPPSWNTAPKPFIQACNNAIQYLQSLQSLQSKNNNNNNNNNIDNIIDNNKYNIARLAFLFTHNLQDIHTTLIGWTNTQQFYSNIQWLSQYIDNNYQLTEEDQTMIQYLQNNIFHDVMNIGWIEEGSEKNIIESLTKYWRQKHMPV